MKTHPSIAGLRSRHSGSMIYLEVTFDARPLDQPGAQWLTLQEPEHPANDNGNALRMMGSFPRETTAGEQPFKIGKTKRLVEVRPGEQELTRVIGLHVAAQFPYCIIRHTRLLDGAVRDEQIYPWPLPPQEETHAVSLF